MGFGKDGTGAIIRENTLLTMGALAAGLALRFPAITLGEDFRMLKSEISCFIEALTAGEGQGLIFGIANGELSVTEIADCLKANGPTDLNDRANQELAERNVKVLSASNPLFDSAGTHRPFIGNEGGPLIVSKHRWTYSNPEGWNFFIFNDGLTLTTGATARLLATHFGLWVK